MSKHRPVVGLPACLRQVGMHPFHIAGWKYVDAVLRGADCIPVILPAVGSEQDIAGIAAYVDGILLTGSPSNVHPSRYGQEMDNPDMKLDLDRDATVFPLLEKILQDRIPLFAICRGYQELNVALGGTLYREIHKLPGKMDHREDPKQALEVQYGSAHRIRLTEGGRLQRLMDGASELQVNSLHSQGVQNLASTLVVEAVADDGIIESYSLANEQHFVFGVQWHPEWLHLENPISRKLFTAFGVACKEYQSRKK